MIPIRISNQEFFFFIRMRLNNLHTYNVCWTNLPFILAQIFFNSRRKGCWWKWILIRSNEIFTARSERMVRARANTFRVTTFP